MKPVYGVEVNLKQAMLAVTPFSIMMKNKQVYLHPNQE